jgi:hypothetical protein
MTDDFDDYDDYDGIIVDDDPALDYILFEEMTKEADGQPDRSNSGCLGVVIVFLVPFASGVLWLIR